MSGSKGWVTNTPDAPHTDGETPSAARSTTTLTMVFVGCIGVIATTMYASQPLLGLIGPAIGLGQSWLGLIPTVTMFGYSVGLLLLVPLLDRLENRWLILATMSLCASAISGAALAINVWGFLGTSFLIGVGACAIQMLVPTAAFLVSKERRGRILGAIQCAMMIGIFISRLCVPKTLSVLMEQWNHLSWRNDRAAPFRFGRPGLAIQVEVAA
jgi:MFS family permease